MAEALTRGLVVGLGSIGRRHLANLRGLMPDVELCALRRTGREVPFPEVTVVSSMEEALAWGPHFAILASPSPFHVAEAQRLAEAGVHLLVEKPLSDRLDGVDRLLETVRAKGLTFMTAYNLRFATSILALREALPRIGRVVSVRAEVGQYLPDWRPGTDHRQGVTARPELGGGVALELSHEFDLMLWLFGPVAQVTAWADTRGDLGLAVEDHVEALLAFGNGVIGSVHLDMLQRTPSRTCKVVGTEGTLVWDGLTHGVKGFLDGAWQDLHPAGAVDRNAMYVDELAHFLACVASGEAPRITGEDGRRALALALAVKASAGRPVFLENP